MQEESLDNASGGERWPWLFSGFWLAAVLVGLVILWRYANTPAQATEPQPQWPANSQISLNARHPTLVMFVHPHCPCTRASLAELARIAAQCAGRFDGWVVFFKPDDTAADWVQTDLMRDAEQILGILIAIDRNGQIARQFNATTSGHTLLYDPAGKLLFSGGITASRGHAGDNNGEAAIVDLLHGQPGGDSRAPVFGCPIHENTPSH